MTLDDRSTQAFWAPVHGPAVEPPALEDRTVVDVYPTVVHPTVTGGGPPEWMPPPAGSAGPAPGQPGGAGQHRAKLAVAGAIVAAVAATAGITTAVVGSDDSGSAAAPGVPGGQGFAGGQGFGGGPGRGGLDGGGTAALHGSYVVSDGNGGYVTQETQTGTVSAVSAGSITVQSTDGYRGTYVLGSSTSVDNGADQITDVETGHTVRVVATVSGDTATATTLTDATLATTDQQGGTRQGGTRQDGAAQDGTITGT